ncbi:MAG: hypothetical protein ACJ78Y_08665 [Myxococcales bacterium]
MPPASVLPTTPPEANVVLRESFGPGPDLLLARPQGGSGGLRNVFAGTDLGGFWLEYPGSKSAVWSTPSTGGHWIFAFASLNPLEAMASPLQPLPFNGIAFSDWSDGVVTTSDLVIPFRGMATKYSVSAELFPAFLAGSYAGFGLTTSGALNANLPASGQIWVRLTQIDPVANGADGQYDIMAGNSVLASGLVNLEGFNPVQITVDPVAQTFNVMLNGFDLGTWAARLTPSFIAFEGQGWADDLVVRTLP